MPAIVTHHVFGEDASSLLPEGILRGQEDLLAFLLGNQGTDPFWARVTACPRTTRSCHQFATDMHAHHMVEAFISLRNSTTHLSEEDKTIGRAFTLGVAAHYLLDSMTHPFVYAQQAALVEANPELEACANDVHALIESDLDDWLLWQLRQQTNHDNPCMQALVSTERIDRVAGALMSQVAWEVFGLNVGAAEYGRALRDYRLLYRLIDPPTSRTSRMLCKAERLVRGHSRLCAQAHSGVARDDCPAANLKHHQWQDPHTGEKSIASFPDLFHDALIAWPAFSQRMVEGDKSRIEAMVAGINYDGKPL